MAKDAANGSSRRKHIREPPSVPFLWEDQPGVAKKDWRPPVPSLPAPALPSPVNLIASVPFVWEEKPGKPLPMALPSPPTYSPWHNEQRFNNDRRCSGTDDSFSSSTDSLSENSLVSTLAISAAVPVDSHGNGLCETPFSPASETDSSTSSYATGVSNLAGSSFLECLFPLYAQSCSFPGDVACTRETCISLPEEKGDSSNRGNNDDLMARRPLTLGELIMMSRRRSCQWKSVQMAKQNLSMEFINKKAFGCCIFGAGINLLDGLQRKRQHLLKLL